MSEAVLEIRPVGGSLGAEVLGLSADAIDERAAGELRVALAEHLVLFLPGLHPSPADLRKIGALFGPLELHPYIAKVDEAIPEVCQLDSSAPGGVKADLWHTDVTFSQSPPVAALLHMVEGPSHGGDTMWISCPAVYESLSLPMQDFLAGSAASTTTAGRVIARRSTRSCACIRRPDAAAST